MAAAVSAEQQADTFVRSPHKLLIDGDWVEATSGRTLQTLNPAADEVLENYLETKSVVTAL